MAVAEMGWDSIKNDTALNFSDSGDGDGLRFCATTTHPRDVGVVCRATHGVVGNTPIAGGG